MRLLCVAVTTTLGDREATAVTAAVKEIAVVTVITVVVAAIVDARIVAARVAVEAEAAVAATIKLITAS